MGTYKDNIIRGKIKPAPNPLEDALKESELRYRRLFETAQDGILIIDADTGRISDVNPFLVNLLGYSRKDFIDKALWHFGPFKDIRASKAAYQKLIRSGHIRYEHLPLETKDGRSVAVEFISNVYQAGRNRTIQCNIRDNSQRRQAQKMQAVAALAGGISHQFNKALNVITTCICNLEKEGHDEKDWYLKCMAEAAEKMAQLTKQLLAYARGGKYNAETIFLSDLVEGSLSLFEQAKPSFTIETEFSSDLPPIYADRYQMQTVLLAILANAAEAIGTQGRIRITCRKEVLTDEGVKAFSGLRPDIYVCLSVADNGKGMKEETRRRVFEPFFTTHFQGRGLGMAAVYGIVKNHYGWISVESELDVGTTVKIWLPAQSEIDQKMEKMEIRLNDTDNAAYMDENNAYAERK